MRARWATTTASHLLLQQAGRCRGSERLSVPYASRTSNFHHEVELVVALGAGGANITAHKANSMIFGYAVGIDLTRRDLQSDARKDGRPWDHSKGFDRSAPIGAIYPVKGTGVIESAHIWLKVNGKERQNANVSEMTWKVPEIIAELSTLWELAAGDLIFTGTPAGVGALERGTDRGRHRRARYAERAHHLKRTAGQPASSLRCASASSASVVKRKS